MAGFSGRLHGRLCRRRLGIAGYRNDSPYSVGRHLRDALSAALMVSNDRIAAGMGKLLLVQRIDADLPTTGESH